MTREVHPVADLFPMLAEDELAELAEDIKQRGLLQPIVLDAEGRVLDGRNRIAACELLGVEPEFTTYHGDDPDGYALAVNIARRHLSTGARAVIAARAARISGVYKSVQARESDIPRPRIVEADTVLDWAPDLADAVIAGAKPLSVAVETARAKKREAEELAAKMARLRADAPDLLALVDEGRMDVDDATAALGAREDKAQQEADQRAREQHAESVKRAQEIDIARAKAAALVADLQANVHAIRLGVEHGAEDLINKKMVADLREAIDLLEVGL